MKVEWKSCFRIGITILLLILCVWALPSVSSLLLAVFSAVFPLLVGCVIAYLLNILMGTYEKWYFPKAKKTALIKSRRPVCMILSMITLVAVVVLVIALVLPQLGDCIALLFSEIPNVVKTVAKQLEEWDILSEEMFNYLNTLDWKSKIEQIVEVITSGVSNMFDIVLGTLSAVFGGIVTALIAIIFAIYLLFGKEKLAGQYHKLMNRYVKTSITSKVDHVFATINDCFRKYIIGQCAEAVILGVLCTLGMLLFRLPYATMTGAVIALTALIPVAGAYIGGGIGAFMIFTVSPVKAIIFIVFLVVLQQLEGNIIYPRVVGSSIGLPGIWVLAAVTVGGGVMGIAGMLLGVPLAATIYRLLREDVNRTPAAHKAVPDSKCSSEEQQDSPNS